MDDGRTVWRLKREGRRYWLPGAALTLLGLLAAGCAGPRHTSFRSNPFEESFTLPPFLAGPVAVLLTNANSFSARISVDLPSFASRPKSLDGNLLVKGTRLLFAPAMGDRTYIWDQAQNSGYILSEALQGFAPIASSVQIANVSARSGTAAVPETINGRPCRRIDVTVSGNDGLTTKFIVWREASADGFLVRIQSVEGRIPMVISFFDHRRESLAQKLFVPPNGFTRYATAQVLRDELDTRQEAAGKKARREDDEGVSGIGHLNNAAPQYSH